MSSENISDFGAIFDSRRLPGTIGEDAEVSRLPIVRHFPCVDFVSNAAVDQIAGPGGGADGAAFGIDAGDAGDDHIGPAQIERAAVKQRRRRRRRIRVSHAGDHFTHRIGGALDDRIVAGQAGHGDIPVRPERVEPGSGLQAEHVDDQHFHLERGSWCRGAGVRPALPAGNALSRIRVSSSFMHPSRGG